MSQIMVKSMEVTAWVLDWMGYGVYKGFFSLRWRYYNQCVCWCKKGEINNAEEIVAKSLNRWEGRQRNRCRQADTFDEKMCSSLLPLSNVRNEFISCEGLGAAVGDSRQVNCASVTSENGGLKWSGRLKLSAKGPLEKNGYQFSETSQPFFLQVNSAMQV